MTIRMPVLIDWFDRNSWTDLETRFQRMANYAALQRPMASTVTVRDMLEMVKQKMGCSQKHLCIDKRARSTRSSDESYVPVRGLSEEGIQEVPRQLPSLEARRYLGLDITAVNTVWRSRRTFSYFSIIKRLQSVYSLVHQYPIHDQATSSVIYSPSSQLLCIKDLHLVFTRYFYSLPVRHSTHGT